MKKFLLNFSILIALLFSSIEILNFLYVKTNYWKANNVNELLKFEDIPDSISLANVGSSHGIASFDYINVPYQGFNFGLSSQCYLYDYLVLKQYINQFSKNAVLLIPISYFQITRIKTDFKDQRARYYRFLKKEYMDIYSVREKILFSFLPVLTAGDTFRFIYRDIDIPPRSKFMTEPELIKYCTEKYRSWTTDDEHGHVFEAGEEGFVRNKFLISQIVEFCYAKDIQPILITTPITSILNDKYAEKSPGFFDTFYRFTRELLEAYPNLSYFDYSHDPRFENDFSLFRDGDHLNIYGAEKFTAIVISDLQTSGLLSIQLP